MSDSSSPMRGADQPAAKTETHPTQPRGHDRTIVLTLAIASPFLIALVAFLSSWMNDQNRIERALRRGDVLTVQDYVRDHLRDPAKETLVTECLEGALRQHLTEVTDLFERTAIQGEPSFWRKKILATYQASGQGFRTPEELPKILFENDDQETRKLAAAVFRQAPYAFRLQVFETQIQGGFGNKATQDWDPGRLNTILGLAAIALPEDAARIDNLEALDTTFLADKDKENEIEHMVEGDLDEIHDANDASAPMTLTGYMVAQDEPNEYEISLTNGQHAILFTTSTQFQSRGSFSLQATDRGTVPTKIKEEFGGFTQMWHQYSECDETCESTYNTTVEKRRQLEEALQKLHTQHAHAAEALNEAGLKFLQETRQFLQTRSPSDEPALTLDLISNRTYVLGSEQSPTSVALLHGKGETETETYTLEPETFTAGDIEGNGNQGAVAVLATNGGGTATDEQMVAIQDDNGKVTNSFGYALGDRTDILKITIHDHIITMHMKIHGPNDPMCCPTEQTELNLRLVANTLVKVEAPAQ